MQQPVALIFGYGSLLAPRSIAKTIPEFLTRGIDLVPVEVTGWRRTWTAVMPNTSGLRPLVGPQPEGIAFMNVEPDDLAIALGIVFPVDATDIANLDRREHLYDRVDVTAKSRFLVDAVPQSWRSLPIMTYTATTPWRPGGEIPTVGIRTDYRVLITGAGRVLDKQWNLGDRFDSDFGRVNADFPDFQDVEPPVDARYTA